MASSETHGSTRFVLSESKRLRLFSMTVFYFAQGLPIGLYLTAVAAWISQNGASASDVAFLVTTTYLPWSFKFFGAALMDRYTYLAMGRRRIWLIGSQALMVIGLVVAAAASPGPGDIELLAYVGFAIFVGSAMQDVAVDGLAVDILPDEEQGTASAFMFAGQAFGISIGAALGGFLLARYGTTVAFLGFLPLVGGIFLLAVILRERTGEKMLPWTAGQASPDAVSIERANWLGILRITFKSMIKRDSIIYLLAAVAVRATGGMFVAFWPLYATKEAGWSTEDYSAMAATLGLIIAAFGMGAGAFLNAKFGPRRSSVFSAGMYVVLASLFLIWPEMGLIWAGFIFLYMLTDTTSLLYSICTNPIRMRLSDKRVAATQFTIYNSLSNLPVPAGAWILAYTTDLGGRPASMTTVIGLAIFGMIALSLLRIGNVVDEHPEDDMTPRMD
ncbi:MFS transporter [Croceicoccus bisphenolivorans]|uniref:MFS transporter n=1 Tax=Croceicoccus bisphenolivorans TaxID=1783232 RepID=UPI000836715B|nr:MFS transporter [Croceicoccus bisphenolivorans]